MGKLFFSYRLTNKTQETKKKGQDKKRNDVMTAKLALEDPHQF